MNYDHFPSRPEQAAELPSPEFDFENMSIDFVRKLHKVIFYADKAALASEGDDSSLDEAIEQVGEKFDADLENLPYRNIDRAREVILSLASSEQMTDRFAAGCGALASLLRRECELGTTDLTEQTDLMIKLANERDSPVDEVASDSAYRALKEGWWREDVTTRFNQELKEW